MHSLGEHFSLGHALHTLHEKHAIRQFLALVGTGHAIYVKSVGRVAIMGRVLAIRCVGNQIPWRI